MSDSLSDDELERHLEGVSDIVDLAARSVAASPGAFPGTAAHTFSDPTIAKVIEENSEIISWFDVHKEETRSKHQTRKFELEQARMRIDQLRIQEKKTVLSEGGSIANHSALPNQPVRQTSPSLPSPIADTPPQSSASKTAKAAVQLPGGSPLVPRDPVQHRDSYQNPSAVIVDVASPSSCIPGQSSDLTLSQVGGVQASETDSTVTEVFSKTAANEKGAGSAAPNHSNPAVEATEVRTRDSTTAPGANPHAGISRQRELQATSEESDVGAMAKLYANAVSRSADPLPSRSGPLSLMEKEKRFEIVQRHLAKAEAFRRQGAAAKAAEELEHALRHEKELYGPESPNGAKTLGHLGDMRMDMEEYDKALGCYEESIRMYDASGYSDDVVPDFKWRLYDHMAGCCGQIGDQRRQIKFYKRAIKLVKAYIPAAALRLGQMHNNIGCVYRRVGKLNKCRWHTEESLRIQQICYTDEECPDALAQVHQNLANVYLDLREEDKAIQHYKTSIQFREKGPRDANSIMSASTCHHTLAEIYTRRKDLMLAEQHRHQSHLAFDHLTGHDQSRILSQLAAESAQGAVGGAWGDDLDDLTAISNDRQRADELYQSKRYAEAVTAHQKVINAIEALPASRRASRSNQLTLGRYYNNAGDCHVSLYQLQAAKEKFSKAVDVFTNVYGRILEEPASRALYNLGELYQELELLGQADFDEASPVYEWCVDVFEEQGIDEEGRMIWYGQLIRSLGDTYAERAEHEKAVKYYEKVKEQLNLSATADPEELQPVYHSLGDAYYHMQNYPKAEEAYTRSLDLAEFIDLDSSSKSASQSRVASAQLNLGDVYRQTGRLADSEDCLTKSLSTRRRLMSADHGSASDMVDPLHQLGLTLVKMGKRDEALGVYREEKSVRQGLNTSTDEVDAAISELMSSTLGPNKRTGDAS